MSKKPACIEFYTQIKELHPTKLVMMRIGDFYESYGIDAVFLVDICSLNPVGWPDVPKAGFPHQNLAKVLRQLFNSNLNISIVICEERHVAKGKQKSRYINKIVTPSDTSFINELENYSS